MISSSQRPPSERNFGLWFAALCFAAGLWKFTVRPPWLVAGAVLAILAIAAPALLRPFNLLWHQFGLLLAKVMNPVVMAAVYALAIVPIGLLWKLLGRDPLRLRLDRQTESYWVARRDKPQSMLRQF